MRVLMIMAAAASVAGCAARGPDVQMFDANGNYQPSRDNTRKDSMSIGLGFSAVPATF